MDKVNLRFQILKETVIEIVQFIYWLDTRALDMIIVDFEGAIT